MANCDEGASIAQMTLDAGETIIENLKENKCSLDGPLSMKMKRKKA